MAELRRSLRDLVSPSSAGHGEEGARAGLEIKTVDGFQGGQKEVVMFFMIGTFICYTTRSAS